MEGAAGEAVKDDGDGWSKQLQGSKKVQEKLLIY